MPYPAFLEEQLEKCQGERDALQARVDTLRGRLEIGRQYWVAMKNPRRAKDIAAILNSTEDSHD